VIFGLVFVSCDFEVDRNVSCDRVDRQASVPYRANLLTLKLVAMATSLERWEKEDQITTIKYLPYGEHLVKIGTVNLEIICLKGLF